jgi:hypothetical protein
MPGYDDYIAPAPERPTLHSVVRGVLSKHYLDQATDQAGLEGYLHTAMKVLDDHLLGRARAAAQRCDVEDEPVPRTKLQKALLGAVAQFHLNDRPNATLPEFRAAAYARIVADAFHEGTDQEAKRQALLGAPTEIQMIVQDAEERERKFERNRGKPKKPVYPV